MLRELHIKNIAVIEEASVEFDKGFQTLTGETGAGKSILIDSICMALGGRGSKDIIRTGTEYASVTLAFETENGDVFEKLDELDISCEDNLVMITRKLYADGKSKCHINGCLVPLNVVKEIGALLLTVHGQNDNQSILSPKTHIGFVDEYADNKDLLLEYTNKYNELKEIKNELSELETDEREKDSLIELLEFQVKEIEGANLKPGEEEELTERRDFLHNGEQIAEASGGAYYALYGDDQSGSGACDGLSDAIRKLDGIKAFDSRLEEYYERLSSVMAEAEDIMHELRAYSESVDYSQAELDMAESRLSLINDLKRKYGQSIDEILEYAKNSKKRLSDIESSEERKNELKNRIDEETKKLAVIADRLTRSRVDASLRLQECIMNELSDLDMQKMRFSVQIERLENESGDIRFTSSGCDDVEFMISANPGEALKPLSKIASGGEMSRIMLAVKSVLADTDSVETLIFDEIDTGVSGRAAQKIAEKMGKLSLKRQVLCITHLAQIAAMADFHYLIEKSSDETSTKTTVRLIEGNERKAEIARIMGGVEVTELTENAAQEMLDMAKSYKNKQVI